MRRFHHGITTTILLILSCTANLSNVADAQDAEPGKVAPAGQTEAADVVGAEGDEGAAETADEAMTLESATTRAISADITLSPERLGVLIKPLTRDQLETEVKAWQRIVQRIAEAIAEQQDIAFRPANRPAPPIPNRPTSPSRVRHRSGSWSCGRSRASGWSNSKWFSTRTNAGAARRRRISYTSKRSAAWT